MRRLPSPPMTIKAVELRLARVAHRLGRAVDRRPPASAVGRMANGLQRLVVPRTVPPLATRSRTCGAGETCDSGARAAPRSRRGCPSVSDPAEAFGGAHHGADDGVQARRVAAAGEHADPADPASWRRL